MGARVTIQRGVKRTKMLEWITEAGPCTLPQHTYARTSHPMRERVAGFRKP